MLDDEDVVVEAKMQDLGFWSICAILSRGYFKVHCLSLLKGWKLDICKLCLSLLFGALGLLMRDHGSGISHTR